MKSYSQQGEDLIVQEHLALCCENVTFLDIGAFDGITHSNTRVFAEKGWRGTYVEAEARGFAALRRDLYDDVHATCVQALVTPKEEGLKPFWVADDSSVSTCDARHKERWTTQAGVDYSLTWVASVSVKDLLALFPGPYDLVSIDTEGTSDAIAMQMPFTGTKAAIIEYGYDPDGLEAHMRELGFDLAKKTGSNWVWLR